MTSSKKRELRVVLDANVWISALLWGGKPAEIIKSAENRRVSLFTSEEIMMEISSVLAYPRLAKAYQGSGLRREDLVETVLRIGRFVKVKEKVKVVGDYPADDKFLECAFAAGADYIVSGDKHLLKIICHRKTKILSVNDFLQVIEGES